MPGPIALPPELAHLIRRLQGDVAALKKKPRSITEEIDAIDGRRIFYTMIGALAFDISLNRTRAPAIAMPISQDGPFIQTHYPLAMWRPSQPATATDFGRWRPVITWPLPDQVLDDDIIDISYEVVDAGSGRNFQSAAVPGGLLSRPDNLIPLPVPTLFTPNTIIQFIPTFENILFSPGVAVPATEGVLIVALPGYRVVNL